MAEDPYPVNESELYPIGHPAWKEITKRSRPYRFHFYDYLLRQKSWSTRAFGPGHRTKGILTHIRKECEEVERAPLDVEEWCDIAILALDGAWRTGASVQTIIDTLAQKQAKNMARKWPDWRTLTEDDPIEHEVDDYGSDAHDED